ncbi:MAG: hypothetical protein ACI8WB_002841 [Phenylobacterium sp.]|jgi:hypothetical protein
MKKVLMFALTALTMSLTVSAAQLDVSTAKCCSGEIEPPMVASIKH